MEASGDLAPFGLLENLLDPALGDWDFSLSAGELSEYTTPDSGTDELLVLASQQFESSQGIPSQVVPADSAADIPAVCDHPPPVTSHTTLLTQGAGIAEDVAIPDDIIFLTASQQFELEHDTVQANPSKPSRFGAPVTSIVVEQARESGVPPKTRQQTSWSCRVWGAWAKERNKLPRTETYESDHELLEDFTKMNVKSLQFWLPKFVLEVRRADQQHYPPDSLYAICAGLQRGLKSRSGRCANICGC